MLIRYTKIPDAIHYQNRCILFSFINRFTIRSQQGSGWRGCSNIASGGRPFCAEDGVIFGLTGVLLQARYFRFLADTCTVAPNRCLC